MLIMLIDHLRQLIGTSYMVRLWYYRFN